MAFEMTLVDRISFGNVKMRSYTITDAPAAATTFDVGMTVMQVKAINNTDSSDTFKEKISSTIPSAIVLDPVTADDDGHMIVWGR